MLSEKTLAWPSASKATNTQAAKHLPLLGSALAFGKDPLSFLEGLSNDFDVAKFRLGKLKMHLVNDPALIGELLRSKDGSYSKSDFADELRQIIGNGLVTSEGDDWLKHRKIISPVMQRKHLDTYAPAITKLAQHYSYQLKDGEQDIHEHMMTLTLEIIADTLFKAETSGCAHAVSQSLEQATTHFHTIAMSWQRLLPKKLPTLARRQYKKESQYLDQVVSGMVTSYQDSPRDGATLLKILTEAKQRNEISQRQICDEALTMFLAGHETTALALSYTLYLLAGDTQAQQRLQQEVDKLGDKSLDASDMEQLTFCQACINEAMRIYPPIWSIIRKATRTTRLGHHEFKKDDHLMVSQWTLSRNPEWFPEPELFKPQRWLDASVPPRFSFIPFGAGGRKCIGDQFAMLEATLVLAETIRRAEFKRCENFSLKLVPSVTLRPKQGIRLNIKLRQQAG